MFKVEMGTKCQNIYLGDKENIMHRKIDRISTVQCTPNTCLHFEINLELDNLFLHS